ncbi:MULTISPECIES: DUF4236 domain-containing protein [Lysinibacillus]|uniref:DUF4236 domain-containing protein n=1 Tax=Lysinibacillus TaxID=400634 RepID=UPI00055CE4B8|nr:DUF4236 domain-containing protein [Lysinibacillus sphaericus]
MGFRFRKSVKIAPGVKLNLAKRGASVTFGNKYARTTFGKNRTTISSSIPGTGISYSKQITKRNKRPQRIAYETTNNTLPDITPNLQEVEKYNTYINMLTSVHLEAENDVNWHLVAEEDLSHLLNEGPNVTSVMNEIANYKPTLRDKLFNRITAKKTIIENKLPEAKELDFEIYQKKQRLKDAALQILTGNSDAWILAITEYAPFEDIESFGSKISFDINNNELIVTLMVGNEEVVPTDVLTLTATNKLSRKKMTKTNYLALYQDYVCSCVIRIAREIFAILPIDKVLIHVYDFGQADSPPKKGCILSTRIYRGNLTNLEFESIDCSDTIETFEHNMTYLKTKGFRLVEELK